MQASSVRVRLRRHPLAAVIALALAGAPLAAAHADSLPVTSCADDGSPGTLRSVVAAAHDGDTIDMTQLTCGTITLTQGPIDAGQTGYLTFAGPGQEQLTVSGNNASPILRGIGNGGSGFGILTFRDLTIAHGRMSPSTYQRAGCLNTSVSTIVLERVVLTDCHAYFDPGYGLVVEAGAVNANVLTLIDTTINDSSVRIVNGSGSARGGGASGVNVTLVRSTISGNSAVGQSASQQPGGGGLWVGNNLAMVDSSIFGNYANATNAGQDSPGGGVYIGVNVEMLRSLIANNSADGDGGGLFNAGFGTTFTILSSTIAGNTAGGTGGGVYGAVPLTLANSTIAGNSSTLGSAVRLNLYRQDFYGNTYVLGWPDFESSIVAGNSAGPGLYADFSVDAPVTLFGAHDFIGDADAGITLPPGTLRGNPYLNPLADNGGRSETMAPMAGSPVIDHGANALGFVVDQRGPGFPRVVGAAADIGAYEVQPPPAPGSAGPAPIVQARGVANRPPTILPVTSCADDGSPGTLRAVAAAAIDGDTIDMTGLTCSVITLTQGAIDTSMLGPNPLDTVTIAGPGRDALTISGNGNSAVFIAGGPNFGGTFTLSNLTVAHGSKYDASACVSVFVDRAVLDGVTATDCHTRWIGGGGGSWLRDPGGGAVSATHLTLDNSTVSDSSITAIDRNVAAGGGIGAGYALLVGSTVSGNSVSAPVQFADLGYRTAGGGVYASGRLYVYDSTIAGNAVAATEPGQDANGGGVAANSVFTIAGSTISGNSADGIGGGAIGSLSNYHPPMAALPTEALGILNSTFTGNSAGLAGAFADANALPVANSTIASNTSRYGGAVGILWSGTYDYSYTLYLDSTIIANNRIDGPGGHAADLATSPNLTLTVIGANNLVGAADPSVTLPPDTLGGDPLLLSLADNGGPTWTMALAPGSPAINAGNNSANLEFDQRGAGFPRVFGPAADIGAYELQSTPNVIFASGFDP